MRDPHRIAELVSLALVLILFDGGVGLGRARPGNLWRPVTVLGLLGTLLSTAGLAGGMHWLAGLDVYPSLLLGAAFAPTDPAVVFALLRQPHGERSAVSIVLEGESGANDPVGIAVVSALLAVGGASGSALTDAGGHLLQQLTVGAAVGFGAGWVARRVGNRPAGVVAAFAGYGIAVLAGGSGFLAAFLVGICCGAAGADELPVAVVRAARLAAFGLLALTLHPDVLGEQYVWTRGLALGALAAFVVRPAAAAVSLWRSALGARERLFVGWIGLKGAVPLLLGLQLVVHSAPDAPRLYGVVVIAVAFSVLVQGGTVAPLQRRLTSRA